MSCKPVCKLCDKLVISSGVTFTGGNVVINIPAGDYRNGCKYCLVVAQAMDINLSIQLFFFFECRGDKLNLICFVLNTAHQSYTAM